MTEFMGIQIKQHPSVFKIFKKFFNDKFVEPFDRIIELGTGTGGFTLFLAFFSKVNVYTFDEKNKLNDFVVRQFDQHNIRFFQENIFENSNIESLIDVEGKVLILCDNGNKINEVKKFYNFMKNGDVIMAHDYFPTKKDFEMQNEWNSCEITDEDINILCLFPYYQNFFSKCYWMSKIMKN